MTHPTKEQLDALEKRLQEFDSEKSCDLMCPVPRNLDGAEATIAIASLRAQLAEAAARVELWIKQASEMEAQRDNMKAERDAALSRERELCDQLEVSEAAHKTKTLMIVELRALLKSITANLACVSEGASDLDCAEVPIGLLRAVRAKLAEEPPK